MGQTVCLPSWSETANREDRSLPFHPYFSSRRFSFLDLATARMGALALRARKNGRFFIFSKAPLPAAILADSPRYWRDWGLSYARGWGLGRARRTAGRASRAAAAFVCAVGLF